jgi:hypothetical protein
VSGLNLSLKLPRTHFGSSNYGQVDQMMQLKKQDQTDDQASEFDTSQIHDLDQIFLYKNLKWKDVHSNSNKIRAGQAHGCLSKPNMK